MPEITTSLTSLQGGDVEEKSQPGGGADKNKTIVNTAQPNVQLKKNVEMASRARL